MPLGHHIVIALVDRRVIATDDAARREYARVVTRIGERHGLIAHGNPDNHSHLVTTCDRVGAGVFAQALEGALRHRLHIEVPFQPAYFKPIHDQSHLRSVIPYVHRQAAHHGVTVDPCGDASSLPDLLGARCIGGRYLGERLAAMAPRIQPAQLLPASLRHCVDTTPSIEQAAEAAAAVIGCGTLEGSSAQHRLAKRAALEVALPAERQRQAAALRSSTRSLSRLVRDPVDTGFVVAVRIQASWRWGQPVDAPRASAAPGLAATH